MNEKKARRLRFWRRAVFLQLFVILAILVTGVVVGYAQLNKMKRVKISKRDEDLGITKRVTPPIIKVEDDKNAGKKETESPVEEAPKTTPESNEIPEKPSKQGSKVVQDKPQEQLRARIDYSDDVRNIALFGIDSGREKWESIHSDAIMILSIDERSGKIKLSSIMRDSYVNVDDHGKTKITNAYAYGGPQLAIKTLNQNFDLDIRDFVAVDFAGFGSIIDSLGGIEVEVKQAEIKEINKYMTEVASIRGDKATPIRQAGAQTLNGNQAVAFARIRAVGNGDYKRTERQQEVLAAIADKIQEVETRDYPRLVSELLPYVETSMSKMDFIMMGGNVMTSGIVDIDWTRFPTNSELKGKTIDKVWYLTFDRNATVEQLHRFIYEDVKPQ
jgi:polyisoprenyl-teichoic acid--peptidoglycan teichoic acid transferase